MRNHTQMLSGFPYGGTLHVGGILKAKIKGVISSFCGYHPMVHVTYCATKLTATDIASGYNSPLKSTSWKVLETILSNCTNIMSKPK